VIHVYNNDTNQEIKRAAVAVKVWDFALSEETELRTAFAVWYNYLGNSYSSDRNQYESDEQYAQLANLNTNCYDFFLRYRISVTDIPSGKIKAMAELFHVPPSYLIDNDARLPIQRPDLIINDEDVKFALFGGDQPITNEMFEEVKMFASFVKERERAKQEKLK
jgi:hypothetical protein